jgi:enoyl-CoA hydratase/carnithine racemase
MSTTETFTTIETYRDETDDRILRIDLDRPGEQNAITPTVVSELGDALKAADRDEQADTIILGTTSDVFCAGGSLPHLKEMDQEAGNRFLTGYIDMVHSLRETGKPTIAAVEGTCVAGGNELVIGADLIVAGESARFGQPEAMVGSTAAGGGVQMMPLIVGEQRAKDLLLTGRLLSAETAEDWGLINRVVPDGDAASEAVSIAKDVIENNSPQAYRIIKSIMKRWNNIAMVDEEVARELTAAVWTSDEFGQRADSFLQDESLEPRPFSGTFDKGDE